MRLDQVFDLIALASAILGVIALAYLGYSLLGP
jgi:hypothetical protein